MQWLGSKAIWIAVSVIARANVTLLLTQRTAKRALQTSLSILLLYKHCPLFFLESVGVLRLFDTALLMRNNKRSTPRTFHKVIRRSL
jgi:hypothetical protein